MFYDKNNALLIYFMARKHHHNMKQLSELLTLTTLSMTLSIWCNIKYVLSRKICFVLMTQL